MNDLEPWKIWAITGVLAATIMAGAELKVRPVNGGEATAEASTLAPNQRPSDVITDPSQASDDYVAYAPSSPHVTFNHTEYAVMQSAANHPAAIMLNVSPEVLSPLDADNREPEVDVSQQLTGADNPPAEEAASLATDLPQDNAAAWVNTIEYSPDVAEQNVYLSDGWIAPVSTVDTVESWLRIDDENNLAGAKDQLGELTDESTVTIVDYDSGTVVALDGPNGNGNPTMMRVIDGPSGQVMARVENAGAWAYATDTTEELDENRVQSVRFPVAEEFEAEGFD